MKYILQSKYNKGGIPESSLADEELRVRKDYLIMEQMQGYKSEKYSASDLSGCFGETLIDWTDNDFATCSCNELV